MVLFPDAPALNCAHVGIAMGSGTAVAKQASDLVLVDDNFCTIVNAVELGRQIYSNIQTFVWFLISNNTVQVMMIFFCVAIGLLSPLEPLSILFVNLASDGLAAVAISVEQGQRGIMNKPPRSPNSPFVTRYGLGFIISHGVLLFIMLFLNFLVGLYWYTGSVFGNMCDTSDFHIEYQPSNGQWNPITAEQCDEAVGRARTMVFIVMCGSEALRAFTIRNPVGSSLENIWSNRVLTIGSLLSCALVLTLIFSPAQSVFGLSSTLTGIGWSLSIGSVLFITICDEIFKWFWRRKFNINQTKTTQQNSKQTIHSQQNETIIEQEMVTIKLSQ